MKKIYTKKWLMMLLAFACGLFSYQGVYAQCDVLSINSVLLDPNGTNNFDTDGNGSFDTNEEFAEICNVSGSTIDLSLYCFGDDDGNAIPMSGMLAPGACIFVVSDWDEVSNPVPPNVIDLNMAAFINNGGDYVQITDCATMDIICEVAAGGVTCPGEDGADCVEFPGDMDGCVNTAAGNVNCDGTLNGGGTTCPDLTAQAPIAVITSESTCATVGGVAGEDGGGVLAAPAAACPAGSTLEYSVDGGTTWVIGLPTYMQTASITVLTRCICDTDITMISPTNTITTTPGACPTDAGCEANEGTFPGTVGGASNN